MAIGSFAASALSGAFSGLLAAAIAQMDGLGGLEGWRWIFLLEGMATGLPLIATAVGEVPTVVLDGRTGIVVPAERPDLLAVRILELLRDPEQRTRLGAAGRWRSGP